MIELIFERLISILSWLPATLVGAHLISGAIHQFKKEKYFAFGVGIILAILFIGSALMAWLGLLKE